MNTTQERVAAGPNASAAVWAQRLWPWVLGAGVVVVMPVIFTSSYAITLMSHMGVMIVFALSYNMLLGNTGLLSFGHAVYFGLGAYTAMHVLRYIQATGFGLPIELIPLVGALAGLFFGIIFGSVSTRRAGVVFAMISLGIGEMVHASAHIFTGFFGGEAGLFGNRTVPSSLFGVDYGPGIAVYYLVMVWTLLAAVAMYLLRQTPLGWMANAVRDNPERAQFVGYSPQMVRFFQFALAATFAGLAGGLYVLVDEIVTDETVGMIQSGTVLLSAYIGGIGSFFGPVLGAILVVFLEGELSDITDAWLLYFGLLFVLVVMFAPQGIFGVLTQQFFAWRAGSWRGSLGPRLYGVASLVVAAIGVVAVIEMAYHYFRHWNPAEPMALFIFEVTVTGPMPWAVALTVAVAGLAAYVGHARPMLRRAMGGGGR
ncbi:branched-chain amino acid ABC transporter permease [Aquisalimonas sp.]|uniref:branched-chain amino acid ABC transporter permease n=1 Tax=Aquisalimonas sp. TaxID=1872621 RepID=UPI0025BC5ACB|nr:branched-chain amino acid ABC transporter permease [Aquisalimonas sp.]